MEHNPDEKEMSGEDKHFGKTSDENDVQLKSDEEGEHEGKHEEQTDPF